MAAALLFAFMPQAVAYAEPKDGIVSERAVYSFDYSGGVITVTRVGGGFTFVTNSFNMSDRNTLAKEIAENNGGSLDYILDLGEPKVTIVSLNGNSEAVFSTSASAFNFRAEVSHPLIDEFNAVGAIVTPGSYKWNYKRLEADRAQQIIFTTQAIDFGMNINGGDYEMYAEAEIQIPYIRGEVDGVIETDIETAKGTGVFEFSVTAASGNLTQPKVGLTYGQLLSDVSIGASPYGVWSWTEDVDQSAKMDADTYYLKADFQPYDPLNYAVEEDVELTVIVSPYELKAVVEEQTSLVGSPIKTISIDFYEILFKRTPTLPFGETYADLIADISFGGEIYSAVKGGKYLLDCVCADTNYKVIFIDKTEYDYYFALGKPHYDIGATSCYYYLLDTTLTADIGGSTIVATNAGGFAYGTYIEAEQLEILIPVNARNGTELKSAYVVQFCNDEDSSFNIAGTTLRIDAGEDIKYVEYKTLGTVKEITIENGSASLEPIVGSFEIYLYKTAANGGGGEVVWGTANTVMAAVIGVLAAGLIAYVILMKKKNIQSGDNSDKNFDENGDDKYCDNDKNEDTVRGENEGER